MSANRRSAPSTSPDDGYVMVMMGLLLIPIIIFTAIAIDVSSWYSRATELQRSADAAALAAVVYLPDEADASTRANQTLERNGIDAADDQIVVTQQAVSLTSYRVCVTDTRVTQFFAAVFASPTQLRRCSTAQFNEPLQLGSPLNYFGGNSNLRAGSKTVMDHNSSTPPGDDYGVAPNNIPNNTNRCWARTGGWRPTTYMYTRTSWGSVTRNTVSSLSNPRCTWTVERSDGQYQPIPDEKSPGMWAAVLGPNGVANNGDKYSTRACSTGPCGVSTSTNPVYRDSGYFYSVDTPSNMQDGALSFQIFDASAYGNSDTGDQSGAVGTRYRVWDGGSTPYDISDDTLVCDQSIDARSSSQAAPYADKWWELCKIDSPNKNHRYYVQVNSYSGGGFNGYALRVVAGGFDSDCVGQIIDGKVSCYGTGVQPRVAGYGDMEMFNGIEAGTPTKFFLANLKPDYAGKKVRIVLWDPGDATDEVNVQVFASGAAGDSKEVGRPVSCTWNRYKINGDPDNNRSYPNSGTASDCKIRTNWDGMTSGGSPMNGRDLEIIVDVPDDEIQRNCKFDGDPLTESGTCWWQIEYTAKNNTHDYTTWTAAIIGDPVRIILDQGD